MYDPERQILYGRGDILYTPVEGTKNRKAALTFKVIKPVNLYQLRKELIQLFSLKRQYLNFIRNARHYGANPGVQYNIALILVRLGYAVPYQKNPGLYTVGTLFDPKPIINVGASTFMNSSTWSFKLFLPVGDKKTFHYLTEFYGNTFRNGAAQNILWE